MARKGVNIQAFGDKALVRGIRKFVDKTQKKLIRRVTKKGTGRLKKLTVAAMTRFVDTGRLLAALTSARVGPLKRRVGVQGHGMEQPKDGKVVRYMNAIEYGFIHAGSGRQIAAKAPIRNAANRNEKSIQGDMGRQLGREMEKEWRKMARKIGRRTR